MLPPQQGWQPLGVTEEIGGNMSPPQQPPSSTAVPAGSGTRMTRNCSQGASQDPDNTRYSPVQTSIAQYSPVQSRTASCSPVQPNAA